MDAGSSVTLIFYCVDQNNVANEPFLNIVAAIAQGSSLTHVEMAIVSAPESSNTHRHLPRWPNGVACMARSWCAGRVSGLRWPDGKRVENLQ